MPVNLREWTMQEFTTPNVPFYHYRGDFYAISGLMPTRDRRQLRRLPAWSSATALGTAMGTIRGCAWAVVGSRHVLIGSNASGVAGDIRTSAFAASSVQTYTAATSYTGGKSLRNVVHAHDALYIIGADGEIYTGAYNGAHSAMSLGATGQVLTLADDRIFVAGDDGIIYRQDDAGSGFDTYFDPVQDMDVHYLAPYKGYLLVVARANDGTLHLYRLPTRNAQGLAPLASILGGTGNMNTLGSFFAIAHDKVWLSPGYRTNTDGTLTVPIYAFNGTNVQLVTLIENIDVGSYYSMGFLPWRDELLFVALDNAASSCDQTFKILLNNKFTDLDVISVEASGAFAPLAFSSAEHLVLTANPSSTEKFYYTQASALQDGYWISSKLDMGQPGRPKRLEAITVQLTDAATDFDILIKYRIDDATSWTTAATDTNTMRATSGTIGSDFYTLQIRIDLDDDTSNNEDIRIESVSVLYSIDS
jgi:hypothetical protein